MATFNLDTFLSEPEGILPPDSPASASQLGFSVVNLSSINETKDQITALEKDLTFCQTLVSPDISHIRNDLEDFFKRLRIKRYFDDVITAHKTITV